MTTPEPPEHPITSIANQIRDAVINSANIPGIWTGIAAHAITAINPALEAEMNRRGILSAQRAATITARDDEITRLRNEITQLAKANRDVYRERAHLTALAARLWPAHWTVDPEDPDWPVLCVHSPAGQLCWHTSPDDQHLYPELPTEENHWDGHTTAEKYQRIGKIISITQENNTPEKHHANQELAEQLQTEHETLHRLQDAYAQQSTRETQLVARLRQMEDDRDAELEAERHTAEARADTILAGQPIDPGAANSMIARRFQRLLDQRTDELAAAITQVTEANGAAGAAERAQDEAEARADATEAAVRALHIKRTGLCPECMVLSPCPTIRALDAAGTPAEVPTTGPEVPTTGRQAAVRVTGAMVRAAIDGALDLEFESFPGPEGRETHRAHDAHGRTSGGYHGLCPFCRLAGAPESVAGPARERVFRTALEAALRAETPPPDREARPAPDGPNDIGWLRDELVGAWHDGYRHDEPLHTVLGMTKTEYAAWATNPDALADQPPASRVAAGDFYEDDEPIEEIRAIWERSPKQLTEPPPLPRLDSATPRADPR